MLTRDQKSKMVYDVKELKEYFDKRFKVARMVDLKLVFTD